MNFKPTKWKIIISILVIILYYLLMIVNANANVNVYLCKPCPQNFNSIDCEKVFTFGIIPGDSPCGCTCPQPTPISSVFSQIFIVLLPGILMYIIWSLIEKKK